MGVHFLALLLVSGIVYDLNFNGKLESQICSNVFVKSFLITRTRSELEHFDISDLLLYIPIETLWSGIYSVLLKTFYIQCSDMEVAV